jgi:hypothetical protein
MTKEAILATKNWSTEYPSIMAENEIEDAMDEWALQFGKWIQQSSYSQCMEDNKWINMEPGDNETLTTEGLYQLFLNQNK